MDHVTINLLSACDLVLRHCKRPDNTWYFEKDSEAHIAVVEAVTQARLALGIDTQDTETASQTDDNVKPQKNQLHYPPVVV